MPKTKGPGIGVDAHGGAVIDPTKNVEDLVQALRETLQEFRTSDQRYLDAQFGWSEKLGNFSRNADTKMVELAAQAESRLRDSLRNADRMLGDAETRRIDQLAQTRQEFQNTIRDMLAESVRTTSTLVSTQLVQIQATFDTRVSKLEAGAFTQAGKSSVADPALSEALARMTATMAALQSSGERTGGQQAGQGQMVGWIAAGVSGLVSIGILVAAVLALHGAH